MPLKHRPETIHELAGGRFTAWVQPTSMKRHYLQCCDCALVHEMQFRVVIDARGKARVQFRARRATRYTAQQRRKR